MQQLDEISDVKDILNNLLVRVLKFPVAQMKNRSPMFFIGFIRWQKNGLPRKKVPGLAMLTFYKAMYKGSFKTLLSFLINDKKWKTRRFIWLPYINTMP